MKRFFPLLLCFALPFYTGCGEVAKDETANVIIISQDALAFAENGGTAAIAVACPSDWNGECQESWLKLEKSPESIVITADANVTGKKRTAVILLSNGADSKEIRVTQAWSNDLVQLYANAPESVKLDSEGEALMFAVSSNSDWTIESADSWLSAETDYGKGLAVIKAAANAGESRTSKVTLSASSGDESKSLTIAVSQISREENPYFRMLGYFGLYAENWYFQGQSLGNAGTATHCTIEQDVYGKSFIINDLFRAGTKITAGYDKEKEVMTIDLGKLCLEMTDGQSANYSFFPVAINFSGASGFSTSMLTGTPGTGYSDESESERDAILLSGFPENYPSFGLVVYTGTGYASDGGSYYADGKMYFVKADGQ
ncbi:MAG: BACON domain-containing protein [Bacteroidales bacterium]|nr:BACON domain-containing protein [Bacteroidales bacterium]